MSDFADIAAEREQELREDALADFRRRYCPDDVNAPDNLVPCTCMDCDEPIPEGRRLALPGIATCVPCQKRRENDQKNRERR